MTYILMVRAGVGGMGKKNKDVKKKLTKKDEI